MRNGSGASKGTWRWWGAGCLGVSLSAALVLALCLFGIGVTLLEVALPYKGLPRTVIGTTGGPSIPTVPAMPCPADGTSGPRDTTQPPLPDVPQGSPFGGMPYSVTQVFGGAQLPGLGICTCEPSYVYNGQFYQYFHAGIDLAAPDGTPIYATLCGVVVEATDGCPAGPNWCNDGWGNRVIIANGPYEEYCAHEQAGSILVSVGQSVKRGQQVGAEGDSGNSFGSHCHYEVLYNGVPLDPAPFL